MKLLITTQALDRNHPVLGFFHNWVAQFSKYFERVYVICLQEGECDLPPNVEVFSLSKERGVSKLSYILRFYKTIWSKRKEYDGVFVHMNPEYMLLGGLFWRILRKKTALWYTHKNVDLKLKIAEKLVNKIFTASSKSFRLESKKVETLGHGIDISKFSSFENSFRSYTSESERRENNENSSLLISIGRISPSKNYMLMIDAVKMLLKKGIDVKLKIVGAPASPRDEDYLEELKSKIAKNNLRNAIKLTKAIPYEKIEDELRKANIFINTSETGSMDKAVLEAMSAGVFVITSNEAFYELSKIDKVLFLQDKTAEKLAGNVKRILEMPRNRKKEIKEKLREEVFQKHNLENLIKKIYNFYNEK